MSWVRHLSQCPDVAYHIVGMKKVQQALAEPGAVERFAPAADASLLRSTFAGMWSLDASESKGSADESRLVRGDDYASATPAAVLTHTRGMTPARNRLR